MDVTFTEQELRTLETALDGWIKHREAESKFSSGIVQIIADGLPDEQAADLLRQNEESMARARAELADDRDTATLLRAKLVAMRRDLETSRRLQAELQRQNMRIIHGSGPKDGAATEDGEEET